MWQLSSDVNGTPGPLDNAGGQLASFATDRDGQAVADQVTLHLTVGGRVSACPAQAITMPVTSGLGLKASWSCTGSGILLPTMTDSSQSDPSETLVYAGREEALGFDWELYLRQVPGYATPMDALVVRVPGIGGAGCGVFDLDEPVELETLGSELGEIGPRLLVAFYVMPKGSKQTGSADVLCADGSTIPGHIVALADRAVDIYVCFIDRPASRLRLVVDGEAIEQTIDTGGFDI